MKKYKLPKEFAEKWLEALRSERYIQGFGSLVTFDFSHCCIGVAGAVCGATNDELQRMGGTISRVDTIHVKDKNIFEERFPEELFSGPKIDLDELPRLLIRLNDGIKEKYLKDGSEFYNKIDILNELNWNCINLSKDVKFTEHDFTEIQLSFKQIAQFIEDNVEFYE